ncbi:MAG: hypothetical protein ACYS67_01555 [Planctomycetota bacterium]|jgi:hypothetical protein
MKRYLTIFVLLCTISTAHGVHFVYHAGGFRAYYDVYAWDNSFIYDGRWTLTQDNTSSVSVGRTSPGVPQAYFEVMNNIGSKTSTNSIRIQSYSFALGVADTGSSYARAKGFTRTQNALTKGIFYKIIPDVNEQNGDAVMVYYNHTVNTSASGSTLLYIGGPGTMDHIAITLGQLPPVTTEPDREKEVLSFPDVNVTNGASADWFSDIHAFPAKIGDVIGIFAENSTAVEGWGVNGWIHSTFSMVLSVETVLLGDLDFDYDVDFFDLAIFANNWLVDIGFEPPPDTTPPEPNPMQWAAGGQPKEIECPGGYCATMTAQTATDPSGGVQYEFRCTDESGFNSGWQSSPSYTVLVSTYSGHNYSFKVRARDIHDNKTDWSPALPMN